MWNRYLKLINDNMNINYNIRTWDVVQRHDVFV